MASQSSVSLALLLVLVGAGTTVLSQYSPPPPPSQNIPPQFPPPSPPRPYPPPTSSPISSYDNNEVQFLGQFGVDQYNKNNVPPLCFIQVFDGTVVNLYGEQYNKRVWVLFLKAQNCTLSGTEAKYATVIGENVLIPGDMQAYGSYFTYQSLAKYNN